MSNDVASFSLEGFEEFRQKLAALGADVSKELGKAGKAAMELTIEAAAKRKVEENKSNDTGTLRASIKTELVDESTVRTGSTVAYAPYVEYGTGIYAEGGDGRTTPWLWKVDSKKWADIFGIPRGTTILWYGSHPHPFLRPAVDENKDKISEEMVKRLEAVIGKHIKRNL